MNRCVLKKYWRFNGITGQIIRCLSQNHYDVLGLKMDASPQEIKTAYKQLCKKYHPDVNRDDPKTHEKFIRLKEAYTVLGKVMTRKEYDRELIARQNYGRNLHVNDFGDSRFSQRPGFEGDRFYTYPNYEEVLWNRRHYPDKYCKEFDRSGGRQENMFTSNWSITSLILGGVVLSITLFTISGRNLTNQLDERDKRAARTWREVQQKRILLAQEAKLKEESAEISSNKS